MPGFTAPKLLLAARARARRLRPHRRACCCPRTGCACGSPASAVTEMSDASGTLWLDVARARWSDELLAACGLEPRADAARSWKAATLAGHAAARARGALGPAGRDVVVAGGGGDNAASAVGIGAVRPGQGFVSLGTSGVVFVVDRPLPRPIPRLAVHAFCHALPARWHQMSVMLSAASALRWAATAARRRATKPRCCVAAEALARRAQRAGRRSSCLTCPANARRTTTRARKACCSA